jgi:hypothetical protein
MLSRVDLSLPCSTLPGRVFLKLTPVNITTRQHSELSTVIFFGQSSTLNVQL